MKFNFSANWWPKLICLGIAIILWVFIMNDQNPLVEGRYALQVETQHGDPALVAMQVPSVVHVKLRMPRNTMLHTRESDMKAIVDLSDLAAGEYEKIPVHLVIPNGAEILEQDPKTFTLRLEHLSIRTLKLVPQAVGEAKHGWQAKDIKLTPGEVTISGPHSAVEKVATAVVPIELKGHEGPFEDLVPIQLRDAAGNAVTDVHAAPDNVRVHVELTPDRQLKEVPLAVKIVGKPAPGYRVTDVTLNPTKVTLSGKLDNNDLSEWSVGEISVEGADRDITTQIAVPYPENGDATPGVVEAHIRIERE